MWLTEEQQQIWRGYLTMASRLQIAMHRQLQQDCGLSLADYDVLVALSERGPLRINQLGEVAGLGAEPGVTPAAADARPWIGGSGTATATTGAGRPPS